MSEGERFEIWQARPEIYVVWIIFPGWLLFSLLQRSNLIDHIPVWATLAGAIVGGWSIAYLSFRIFRKGRSALKPKATFALMFLPVFGVFLGTHLARSAWDLVAFKGVERATVSMQATVVSIYTKRRNQAFVTIAPNSRRISIRVNEELFEKLEPWRARGRDCLVVTIESGKYGARRVLLPNYLDQSWGLEHYQQCDS